MTTEKMMNDRKKMVMAMEYIARQVNDEEVFEYWLMDGVADGDIRYGDFDIANTEEYYTEDETFRDLMDCFLRLMARAKKSGGLYCGDITTMEG